MGCCGWLVSVGPGLEDEGWCAAAGGGAGGTGSMARMCLGATERRGDLASARACELRGNREVIVYRARQNGPTVVRFRSGSGSRRPDRQGRMPALEDRDRDREL